MRKVKARLSVVVPHVILAGFSLCILLPLVWVFRVSLTDKLTAYKIPPEVGRLGFENYIEIFSAYPFERWFLNSLIVALVSTAISPVIASSTTRRSRSFATDAAAQRWTSSAPSAPRC